MNYRSKMWSTEKSAERYEKINALCGFLCANDEDFEASLGIHAFDGDMAHGIDQIETYKKRHGRNYKAISNCKAVASVLETFIP